MGIGKVTQALAHFYQEIVTGVYLLLALQMPPAVVLGLQSHHRAGQPAATQQLPSIHHGPNSFPWHHKLFQTNHGQTSLLTHTPSPALSTESSPVQIEHLKGKTNVLKTKHDICSHFTLIIPNIQNSVRANFSVEGVILGLLPLCCPSPHNISSMHCAAVDGTKMLILIIKSCLHICSLTIEKQT